jgi:hypothetical protein
MKPRRIVIDGVGKCGVAMAGVGILAGAGILVATHPCWRPWCLTWGATAEEVDAELPGDDLLMETSVITTRAVSIDAPPEAVWPWLAQMGSGRGGLYTYDWIENLLGLHMHSVDVVLPEFQTVKMGDFQTLGQKGPTLRIAICEQSQHLVLRSDDGHWVWGFILQREGTGTRLLSRNRIALPGASRGMRWFYRFVIEPGSLIMERKMLLGIKERAERLVTAGPSGHTPPA